MREPAVTDLCVNAGESIFVDRGHGLQRETGAPPWPESELREWVIDALARSGKTWDARNPFADATIEPTLTLAKSPTRWRLHAAFPPASPVGILLSLRRIGQPALIYEGGAERRWGPFFSWLSERASQGDSILVSGATGSGKTTLVNDLLGALPHEERVITLEDTPELSPSHPHFIRLLSRPASADGFGQVTLRHLLKQCLRMRPDRIVLGECRGEEVLELLQLLNTGHRGALATLHANSARDALRRVELLALLGAQGTIPRTVIQELVAHGIHWVVQLERGNGGRKIVEIVHVEGREGDTILLRPMLRPTHGLVPATP